MLSEALRQVCAGGSVGDVGCDVRGDGGGGEGGVVVVCDSAMLLQVQVRRETAARLTHYKEGDGASVFVECCVERDTRRTSHVTRHTSHVTRHTSHVTRHASHVTRHASHVTRHTSRIAGSRLQAMMKEIKGIISKGPWESIAVVRVVCHMSNVTHVKCDTCQM